MRGWVGACGSISRALHVLAYVCVCLCARMHAYGWRILSVLVRMLDSTFAGSVVCHMLISISTSLCL